MIGRERRQALKLLNALEGSQIILTDVEDLRQTHSEKKPESSSMLEQFDRPLAAGQ